MSKPIRVYIATRLENHELYKKVADILKTLRVEITYDWTPHGPVYSEGEERLSAVSILEHHGIVVADAVIALLPGGRGTHVEIGMGLALNKLVFIHADPVHNLLIASEQTCAFYHHPRAVHCHHEDLVDFCMFVVNSIINDRMSNE